MNITIIESKLRFSNPNTGHATRAIEEHYNGRRVTADVDGEEQMFRFNKGDLPFEATEEDIENAINDKLNN